MKATHGTRPIWNAASRHKGRRAFSMIDLLVAFTLLAAAMSVATPLIVRHAQLLKSQRNYRLALDELSNHLDRLTVLTPGELPRAIEELAPSTFVAERLREAKLSGKIDEMAGGARVTLELVWMEMGNRKQPLRLAAWLFEGPMTGSNATGAIEP